MKILVTGGAGFIGSHLCDRLVEQGAEVICVDNLSSGSPNNIQHLIDNHQFNFIQHDVTKPLAKVGELSAIFHLASPASPNPDSPDSYVNHPVETLLVNSQGTHAMLELATANHCPIILASTSEVYGDPMVHPQPESYWGHVSPHGVRSCYDEGKRFLEAIAFAYFRTRQTKIKVARIFNTYGERMRLDDGRLIPSLVDSVLHQKPFKLYGDGASSRSFCYIDDLIDALLAMHHNPEAVGQVINLGNPTEYTISEVITMVEKVANLQVQLVRLPALPDDPRRRRPDIAKAQKLLGWTPQFDFVAGLARMLKFYS